MILYFDIDVRENVPGEGTRVKRYTALVEIPDGETPTGLRMRVGSGPTPILWTSFAPDHYETTGDGQ